MKALFLLFAISTIWLPALAESNESVNCDIQRQACTQSLKDISVTLDIQPKPVKAMHELTFCVTLTGSQPLEPPYIELGMPKMKIGRFAPLTRCPAKGAKFGLEKKTA